jgi:predicted XRE-type DNA-binding protein
MIIADLLKRRKLSQKEAAKLLGTTQPRVSSIVRFTLKEISLEKLMEFLTRLDQDVEIAVRRKPRARAGGEVSVVV